MGGCILLSCPLKPAGSGPLTGKALYSPNVIASYSAFLGFPLATFLYGVNVFRRGSTSMGAILCVVSGASYLFLRTAMSFGVDVKTYSFVGLFGALGLHQIESASFAIGRNSGAGLARWWVPLAVVAVVGLMLQGARVLLSW